MALRKLPLCKALNVTKGLTALIGGGGKTTAMYRLAEELRPAGTVIVCTSTRIRRPEQYPLLTTGDADTLSSALERHGVICVGTPAAEEKLAAPALRFETLAALADYVIVEADGAKCLPLKAHAPHEPVIPSNAVQTVLVLGADGFGRPIAETCHRPELYAQLAEAALSDPVTPELAARVIRREGFGDRVFFNQAESEAALAAARALAALLPCPVAAGSLFRGEYVCLS